MRAVQPLPMLLFLSLFIGDMLSSNSGTRLSTLAFLGYATLVLVVAGIYLRGLAAMRGTGEGIAVTVAIFCGYFFLIRRVRCARLDCKT
jgi:hypothetical protein